MSVSTVLRRAVVPLLLRRSTFNTRTYLCPARSARTEIKANWKQTPLVKVNSSYPLSICQPLRRYYHDARQTWHSHPFGLSVTSDAANSNFSRLWMLLALPVMAAISELTSEEEEQALSQESIPADELRWTEKSCVIEKGTGFAIPKAVFIPMSDDPSRNEKLVLVGTAPRTVTIFAFLTYAMGVYVEENELRKQASQSQDPEDLFNKLTSEDSSAKDLKFIPYRQIDSTHFATSLSSVIVSRLKTQQAELTKAPLSPEESAKIDALATTWRGLFKTKAIEAGQHVDIVLQKDTVSVYLNGKLQGSMKHKEWTQILFDMFFGAKPKSPDFKKKLLASVSTSIFANKKQ